MNNEQQKLEQIRQEINKVIVGKNYIIDRILAAILAGGHVLLEDVPGVGKTTLALAFSRAMSLDYKRLQFTPDVLPSDIIGFSMYNKKINDFEYKEGAAVANLFLADEINRTSPKTQAALLEVMEEGKVTVDSVTRQLPSPFVVIATQNPIGYVGTQKLPESQLDRFMLKLTMGYPDFLSEMMIYQGNQHAALDTINGVVTKEEIVQMKEDVQKVYVKESVCEYMTNLIQGTRKNQYIELGVSPRGGIALLNMAKAMAYMAGRDYVVPEDILEPFYDVILHRIVLNARAKASGLDEKTILEQVIDGLAMPESK